MLAVTTFLGLVIVMGYLVVAAGVYGLLRNENRKEFEKIGSNKFAGEEVVFFSIYWPLSILLLIFGRRKPEPKKTETAVK